MTSATPQQLDWALRATLPNGRIEVQQLPLAPSIELFLIASDYPRGPLPREAMAVIMEKPAYWAFCWASGQALARHVLDYPELVHNKRVLDFGSGSGVVGIAAAMAGARHVTACDLDAGARCATKVNAAHNNVTGDVVGALNIAQAHACYDIVLVADVLYDVTNLPLLREFTAAVAEIIIADSRMKSIPLPGIQVIAQYETSTMPDLDESPEFRRVSIYRWCRDRPR